MGDELTRDLEKLAELTARAELLLLAVARPEIAEACCVAAEALAAGLLTPDEH